MYIVAILIFGAIIFIGVYLKMFPQTKSNYNKPPDTKPYRKFKGLCLFDIDGTLTTGQHNEEVVQLCLDRGFAVGINTAGSIYSPDNVMKPPFNNWMPKNLYQFMKEHNFDTFNNIASGLLMGKDGRSKYNQIEKIRPTNAPLPGWLKGYALIKTAKLYGITDPKCMILCDDQISFLQGAYYFNPNFNLVCAGDNCEGDLTVSSVKKGLDKCN